jgi:PKD repeat protein
MNQQRMRFLFFFLFVFSILLKVKAQDNKEIYIGFSQEMQLDGTPDKFTLISQFFKDHSDVPVPSAFYFPFAFSRNEDLQHIVRARFSTSNECVKAIAELKKIGWIRYAEFVPINKRFTTPDDLGTNSTGNGGQWYHYKIQAQLAWDLQTGSNAVRVAVIDDAVQTDHTELGGVCLPGFDAAEFDMDVNPPTAAHDHGTHVSGLIAALTDNGEGMASLAHGVRILPVKVTFDSNPDNVVSGFEGIAWAVTNGADIINCSWGSETYSQTGLAVIQDALNAGITVVAAAGNFNNSVVQFPAGYDGVIAVGATSSGDSRSTFSNYGSWINVSAPGSQIWSLAPNNGYQIKNGTSFAAPLVSALAALLKSYNPNLTPSEIQACIQGSADDISFLNPGFIGLIGSGRINAYEAIRCVQLETAQYNVSLELVDAIPEQVCSGQINPSIRITNTGAEPLNSFTIRSQLGSNPPFFYPVDTLLLQGQSFILPMQPINPAPGSQSYRIQLVGLLNGQYTDMYGPDNLLQQAIFVNGGLGTALPFIENFESGSFSTNGWMVVNDTDSFNWEIMAATSPEPGTKAAVLSYFINSHVYTRDYLVTPPLDFSGISDATIRFDFAYMPRFQNLSDSLILSYSTDCGASFTRLLTLFGDNLATTQAFPDNFIASQSSLWCGANGFADCIDINIDSLAGNSRVVFRWEGYCNNGNNIYIDNIRIEGTASNLAPQAAFNASWDLPACAGSSVLFQNESTGNPTSYFWTFEGGTPAESTLENPEVSYAVPGIYAVGLSVSNENGSDTVSFSDFALVEALPQIAVVSTSDSICSGNSAELSASGASYYYWNSGPAMSSTLGNSVIVSPQSNATYTVNGVSEEGCSASASLQISVVTQPAIPTISVNGVNLVASPGIAYEWYLDGVLLPEETAQSIIPLQNGNYNVRVYIQENCSSISAIFPVNFAGNFSMQSFNALLVYPNPANDIVRIANPEQVELVQLFNAIGQRVFTSNFAHHSISTQMLASGIYTIVIHTVGGDKRSQQMQIVRE